MDRTEDYRRIVRKVIEEYAGYKPSHGQIETEAVVDREHDHYGVMHVGWDGARRVLPKPGRKAEDLEERPLSITERVGTVVDALPRTGSLVTVPEDWYGQELP